MNIHEAHKRYRISLATLRRMERDKFISLDAEDLDAAKMRYYLARREPLTVGLLLAALDEPRILDELGRYEERGREQVAALGAVADEAAPSLVNAYTSDAAANDPAAVKVLVNWLREVLPVKPVTYYWIATRLLFGLPPNLRESDLRLVNIALLNVRKAPEFSGYWEGRQGRKGRETVFYSQPNKFLDL